MVSLHHNGLSGILADEMVRCHLLFISQADPSSQGPGKMLQTLSFLAYLKHHLDITGPHLIVVLTGTKEERADIIAN